MTARRRCFSNFGPRDICVLTVIVLTQLEDNALKIMRSISAYYMVIKFSRDILTNEINKKRGENVMHEV